jgi:DNA-binding beta-propeller fold protein YncE
LRYITRREWIAFTGLAVSSACRPRKGTGFPGYALVSNSGDDSVAAVDLTGFRVVRIIPLGAPPHQVLLASKGQSFVLTPTTGTIHVLNPDLRVLKSRRFSDNLSAMCLSPDGNTLIGTAPKARELIVADAHSLSLVHRYKLTAEPASLDVPPPPTAAEGSKPTYVAVSSGRDGSVELFNYATGERWKSELSGSFGAVRFRADGQRLLIANLQERCISALTTPDLQTIANLPLAMSPENLCFNADQGQLFVSGEGMDAVAIIFPYNPLEVEQTVLAGRDPGVMACSDNPGYLFVGSNSGSDVCILNIDSRKVIGIVDTGQCPSYISVTPDSQYALVLSKTGGTLAVIHIPAVLTKAGDPDKWRNKATAGLFTLLPVGDRPVYLAVVPRSA